MTPPADCPDPQLLKRFLTGRVDDQEAHGLEGHLIACDRCLETLSGLQHDDSLVEVARAGPVSVDTDNAPAINALIERVCAATTKTHPKLVRSRKDDADLILGQLAPAQSAEELGRLGPYRLLAMLGSGGMGMVFRAEDTVLKREVALKLMRPGLASEAKQRFLREARAMAALQHDHVVAVYQVGEERDMPYLAMQYLKGMTLADWLTAKPPLTIPQVLKFGRDTSLGLAAAHKKGLVHRDIKPSNLWLEAPKGRVKILDFGLVKPSAETELLTQSGGLMGTPPYMSPEQARSEPLDARSDLFSLGTVLYQALTGKQPFVCDSLVQVIYAVIHKEPPPIRELNPACPQGLADLVMSLLRKQRGDRPQSAQAVIAAFDRLIQEYTAPKLVKAGGARQAPPRWRSLLAASLALIFLPAGLWYGGQIIFTLTDDKGKQLVITIPEPPPGHTTRVEVDGRVVGEVGSPQPSIPLAPPPVLKSGPSPFDAFQRANMSKEALLIAGGGDPASAPAELVAVWGDGRLAPWAPPQAVAFLPGGKQLVSAGQDHLVTLWNAENGLPIHRFQANEAELNIHFESMAVSSDGKTVAAGASNVEHLVLWDVATRREWRKIAVGAGGATALAFQPRGTLLAVGGKDGTLRLWDFLKGTVKLDLKGQPGWIRSMAFSPDGTWLVSGSQATGTFHLPGAPGQVRVWNVASGQPLHTLGSSQMGYAVAVTHDGSLLAAAGNGGKIQLWQAQTGKPIRTLQAPWDKAVSLTFTPDGQRLVASGDDTSVRVFNVESGEETRCLLRTLGMVYSLAMTEQGQLVAIADHAGRLRLCDVVSGEERFPRGAHHARVLAMSLLSSGAWATAGTDGTILLWNAASPEPIGQLRGRRGFVLALAHHGDRGLLASGDNEGAVHLWNPERQLQLWSVQAHASRVKSLAFTPDGGQCISVGDDGWVKAWDPAGGQLIWSAHFPQPVENIAISSEGLVAVDDVQGKIFILDPKHLGRRVLEFQGGKGFSTTLASAPAGSGVLAASFGGAGDFSIRCFRPRTGELLATCKGHGNRVYGLAFNQQGSLLASSSVDGSLGFWSPHTGKLLARTAMTHYGAQVFGIRFAGDGRHLLTGNGNGTIYLMRLSQAMIP